MYWPEEIMNKLFGTEVTGKQFCQLFLAPLCFPGRCDGEKKDTNGKEIGNKGEEPKIFNDQLGMVLTAKKDIDAYYEKHPEVYCDDTVKNRLGGILNALTNPELKEKCEYGKTYYIYGLGWPKNDGGKKKDDYSTKLGNMKSYRYLSFFGASNDEIKAAAKAHGLTVDEMDDASPWGRSHVKLLVTLYETIIDKAFVTQDEKNKAFSRLEELFEEWLKQPENKTPMNTENEPPMEKFKKILESEETVSRKTAWLVLFFLMNNASKDLGSTGAHYNACKNIIWSFFGKPDNGITSYERTITLLFSDFQCLSAAALGVKKSELEIPKSELEILNLIHKCIGNEAARHQKKSDGESPFLWMGEEILNIMKDLYANWGNNAETAEQRLDAFHKKESYLIYATEAKKRNQ